MEGTAFIVDDDAAARESCRVLLDCLGFDAECYATALQFLESVKQERTGFVLVDYRLPGMDGIELLKMMGRKGISLPVIVVTGDGDQSVRTRAWCHGISCKTV